jgi:alkylhydroperoxidase family enzyme
MPPDAWIETIDAEDADDELRELYDAARDPRTGELDNVLKVHGLHPQSLRDHLQLYRTSMYGRGGLTRVERELIAVVVSSLNECHY